MKVVMLKPCVAGGAPRAVGASVELDNKEAKYLLITGKAADPKSDEAKEAVAAAKSAD